MPRARSKTSAEPFDEGDAVYLGLSLDCSAGRHGALPPELKMDELFEFLLNEVGTKLQSMGVRGRWRLVARLSKRKD